MNCPFNSIFQLEMTGTGGLCDHIHFMLFMLQKNFGLARMPAPYLCLLPLVLGFTKYRKYFTPPRPPIKSKRRSNRKKSKTTLLDRVVFK